MTPPGRVIAEVPTDLLPLFNQALSLQYPMAREVDATAAFHGTTTATFALHILDLLPLSQDERVVYVAQARQAYADALAEQHRKAAAERNYQLTGETAARKTNTSAILADILGDISI